jgi:hypothetical protein
MTDSPTILTNAVHSELPERSLEILVVNAYECIGSNIALCFWFSFRFYHAQAQPRFSAGNKQMVYSSRVGLEQTDGRSERTEPGTSTFSIEYQQNNYTSHA